MLAILFLGFVFWSVSRQKKIADDNPENERPTEQQQQQQQQLQLQQQQIQRSQQILPFQMQHREHQYLQYIPPYQQQPQQQQNMSIFHMPVQIPDYSSFPQHGFRHTDMPPTYESVITKGLTNEIRIDRRMSF